MSIRTNTRAFLSFALCICVVPVLYTPRPLISWMACSKKTLLHFIAWGRAIGRNTNKFIRTYPDYPPAVCFQLTHEITQFLETESSLCALITLPSANTIYSGLRNQSIRLAPTTFTSTYVFNDILFAVDVRFRLLGCDGIYIGTEELPPSTRLIPILIFS